MITVALYEKTTKISVDNEERHFVQRLDTLDVDRITPQVQYALDGVSQTFDYDESLSKELGHHVYVRNKNTVRLTPFGGAPDAEHAESDNRPASEGVAVRGDTPSSSSGAGGDGAFKLPDTSKEDSEKTISE